MSSAVPAAVAPANIRPTPQERDAFIANVGRALMSPLGLREQLQQCCEAMVIHLDAAFARIWTLEESTDTLVLNASAGMYTHIDGGHARVPVGSFKIGLIARERLAHLTNDVQTDPRVGDREWARREGMVAFAGYPLISHGRLFGVAAMFARAPLSGAALEALAGVSDMIAVGIERDWSEQDRIRLLAKESERARQLDALAEASLAIHSASDFTQVMQAITEKAARMINAHQALIQLNAPGSAMSQAVYLSEEARKLSPAAAPSEVPSADASVRDSNRALRLTETEVLADARFEAGQGSGALRIRGWLAVPLISRSGQNLGLIRLTDKVEGDFTEEDEWLLVQLARLASVAIENARLTERTRQQAQMLELLHQVGMTLSAELDREKVVQAVTDAATALIGAQFGAFFYNVLREDGGSYMLYTLSGVEKEKFSKFPMPRATAMFAPTFQGEGVVRIGDVRKDPRYGKNAPHHGIPKGHLPVVSYLAVPVRARNGAVIGGLFFGHEKADAFTERHEQLVVGLAAQAAIAMDNARLFSDAQHLIRALERSNQDLDQFAYVASHDLRAPLRGIGHLAQWLEEDIGPALSADTRKQLELLQSRVARMEGLISGILDYSRAAKPQKLDQVDVGKMVSDSIELLAPPKTITFEVASGMPSLRTERVTLQQLLLNLIGNAVKYAGRDRSDARVKISCVEEGDFLAFEVTDNGPGIAKEFHDRIWGLFQKLESRDAVEGAGIGLAVVKKIVETRGGRVWLESSPGNGASFRFTWPKVLKDMKNPQTAALTAGAK